MVIIILVIFTYEIEKLKIKKWEAATSWKVSLKEIRWPSFSVSTRTPSQSKRRAEGRVEEEDAEAEQLNLRLLVVGDGILKAVKDKEVVCCS
jgi:hypothetical protein